MDEKLLSLLFLRKDNRLLLAQKKRGFGAGRWNGAGGKIESGETIEQAMIRETQEEITVTPTTYEQVADLRFVVHYLEGEKTLLHVHAFVATEWEGEPTETEEMAPRWFALEDIPYQDMWSDDPHWLPLVLAGKKISADFEFNENDEVISHSIEEVKGFPL